MTLKFQRDLFYLDSLESSEGGTCSPITLLLNHLPSNAVENIAVIEAAGTVFPPVQRMERTEDNNHELQAQSLANESQAVQSSSYEEEDVPGTSVSIQGGEVDEREELLWRWPRNNTELRW